MRKHLYTEITNYIDQVINSKTQILELTRRDFTSQYVKNYFGLAWAILDPLFFILILWIVFQYRFTTNDVLGIPFSAYLITGYIAYDLFSNSLTSSTNSITNYSFLIKKLNFSASLIPIVKIISNFMMHIIIIFISTIILIVIGIKPTFIWFQVLYYLFSLFLFLIGLSWLTSAINVFFPDIKNIIGIITRLMFFMTPIFWTIEGLPDHYALIMKINPIVYIVDGYRNSLLLNIPFYQDWKYTIYFWGWVFVMLILGAYVFKRLRPHFADVI